MYPQKTIKGQLYKKKKTKIRKSVCQLSGESVTLTICDGCLLANACDKTPSVAGEFTYPTHPWHVLVLPRKPAFTNPKRHKDKRAKMQNELRERWNAFPKLLFFKL